MNFYTLEEDKDTCHVFNEVNTDIKINGCVMLLVVLISKCFIKPFSD